LWAMTSYWLRRTPTRRWRYPAGEFFIMIDFTAQQVTSDLSSGPIWSQVDIKDGPLVCESACKKDPLCGVIFGVPIGCRLTSRGKDVALMSRFSPCLWCAKAGAQNGALRVVSGRILTGRGQKEGVEVDQLTHAPSGPRTREIARPKVASPKTLPKDRCGKRSFAPSERMS
jgi:hypothetical protein